MLYRVAGLLDRSMDGRHDGGALLSALEEFAVECSIVKVAASETLDYVVDENVQIHGGNGFVRDYDAERHYRDARVNRIFEGTNEINRLLIPGMLVKRRDGRGRLQPPAVEAGFSRPDGDASRRMKQAALLVLSTAAEKFGDKLGDQQFVLLPAADILIDVFAADSMAARARDAFASGSRDGISDRRCGSGGSRRPQCSRGNARRQRAARGGQYHS